MAEPVLSPLLLSWLPWALASPLILDLSRRHPLELKSLFAVLVQIQSGSDSVASSVRLKRDSGYAIWAACQVC